MVGLGFGLGFGLGLRLGLGSGSELGAVPMLPTSAQVPLTLTFFTPYFTHVPKA